MDQNYLKRTGSYDDLRQIRKKYGKKGYGFVKSRMLQELGSRYDRWIAENEKAGEKDPLSGSLPLISVFLSGETGEKTDLQASVGSVENQTYPNWELISDPGQKAEGEFIAFLDAGDVMAPDALYEMVKVLQKDPEHDLLYSDEDQISEDGKERFSPFFKPDWSPDLLMDLPYAAHLALYRRSLAEAAGEIRAGLSEAEVYDLLLRFTENCDSHRIGHVPKVLYHRRRRRETVFRDRQGKRRRAEALRYVRQEALARRGISGKTVSVPDMGQYRVVYQAEGEPLVSVIIPSKDNVRVLRRCVLSVRKRTAYKNYEIIVVDNGSSPENKTLVTELCKREHCMYLYKKEPFNFSSMCDRGAASASGEYLLFLNDDTEVRSGDWLDILLGQAALKHAGAVGAKLLYPESHKLQHTGVVGLETGPCHGLQRADDRAVHYFGKNRITWNYSAVTGACLLVSARKFWEAGGFDEEIPVAYNDVDLCLRLYERGYYNSVRNDVVLYHYESLSRGEDNADRLRGERELLYGKHPWYREADPFYSPNLTGGTVDYGIRVKRAFAPGRVKEFRAEHVRLGTGIPFYIDSFETGSLIHVHGWAYEGSGEHSLETEVSLAFLGNNGKSYEVEAQKVFRKDMASAFPDSKGIPFSGFCCDVEACRFDEGGEYQVGILLETRGRQERPIILSGHRWPRASLEKEEIPKMGSLRRRETGKTADPKDMKVNLETVEAEDSVRISGWAFLPDRPDNYLWVRGILLKTETGTLWELSAVWKARPDVAAGCGGENSLMNSGFAVTACPEELRRLGARFWIGVFMRNPKTGEEAACWTEETLELNSCGALPVQLP